MKKLLTVLIVSSLGILTFAQGPGYQKTNIKNHPRVNQVNERIDNQEKRIHNEVKEGDLTKKQAVQDRKNLSEMNQEKKDMRKIDDGHLTKTDQKALNQQLNQNSRRIGQ
jgi:AICAR transformylase/IMP cyclohydrolase PurH